MRYMLLVYADPSLYSNMSETEQKALWQESMSVTSELTARGVRESGEPLQPIDTATTIRFRNGKTLTTDGPFAESQEQLISCHILNCKNLDQALESAAKLPESRFGAIEIRPIREIQQPTELSD